VWPGTPGPAERHSVAVMTGRRTAPGGPRSRDRLIGTWSAQCRVTSGWAASS
jgi:hypothetical protein